MTKGQARNDISGHPGPDPGSNSLVCTDDFRTDANDLRLYKFICLYE